MDNPDTHRTEPSVEQTQSDTRVSYIYRYRKEELIQLAEKLNLDSSGGLEDLRRRVVRHIRGESRAPTPTVPTDPLPVFTTAQVDTVSLNTELAGSPTPPNTVSTLINYSAMTTSLSPPRATPMNHDYSAYNVPIPTLSLTTPTTVTITVTPTPTYSAPRILRSLYTGLVNAQAASIPTVLPISTVASLPITTIYPPVTRPDYPVTVPTATPYSMPLYVPTSWTVPTANLPTTASCPTVTQQQPLPYAAATLPYPPATIPCPLAPTPRYPFAPTPPYPPVLTMPCPPAYSTAVVPPPSQPYTHFPYTSQPATPTMGSPLQISKWGIHFDGRNDPASFLERLEEICLSQNINMDLILPYLPDILRGDAALWYRNNRHAWQTWTDFRTAFRIFYFPVNYEIDLEVAISRRLQKPDEPSSQYITDLQTLIRRHGHISPEQELQWLYRNLLPEFRQQIRRNEFHDVMSFSRAVRDFELLNKEILDSRRVRNRQLSPVNPPALRPSVTPPVRYPVQPPRNRPPGPSAQPEQISRHPPPGGSQGQRSPTTAPMPRQAPRGNTSYTQSMTCWRCGRTGHVRTECRYPAKLFCSRCGREGILSRDCSCRRPEN